MLLRVDSRIREEHFKVIDHESHLVGRPRILIAQCLTGKLEDGDGDGDHGRREITVKKVQQARLGPGWTLKT